MLPRAVALFQPSLRFCSIHFCQVSVLLLQLRYERSTVLMPRNHAYGNSGRDTLYRTCMVVAAGVRGQLTIRPCHLVAHGQMPTASSAISLRRPSITICFWPTRPFGLGSRLARRKSHGYHDWSQPACSRLPIYLDLSLSPPRKDALWTRRPPIRTVCPRTTAFGP